MWNFNSATRRDNRWYSLPRTAPQCRNISQALASERRCHAGGASLCGTFWGGMSVVSVSCWFMLQRNTPPLSFLPCSYLWTPEEMEPLTLSVGCLSSCNFPRTRWRYMLLLRFDCRTGVILRRHKVGIYNSGRVTFCPLLWPFVFKKLQGFRSAKH